ncbi:MAG: hypothetical protein ABWY51_07250 [Gaiellaceae bacterium]
MPSHVEGVSVSVALTENDLLDLSDDELDELFRRSPAGEIPDGDAAGKVLVGSENEDVSDTVSWIAKTLAWKGKVFSREKGELKNKILPFGIKAVRAKVYKEASWFDGVETIVLDYSKTSFFARHVRDEIREVAPGLYLGLVYFKKDKVLHFSLKFDR